MKNYLEEIEKLWNGLKKNQELDENVITMYTFYRDAIKNIENARRKYNLSERNETIKKLKNDFEQAILHLQLIDLAHYFYCIYKNVYADNKKDFQSNNIHNKGKLKRLYSCI